MAKRGQQVTCGFHIVPSPGPGLRWSLGLKYKGKGFLCPHGEAKTPMARSEKLCPVCACLSLRSVLIPSFP